MGVQAFLQAVEFWGQRLAFLWTQYRNAIAPRGMHVAIVESLRMRGGSLFAGACARTHRSYREDVS